MHRWAIFSERCMIWRQNLCRDDTSRPDIASASLEIQGEIRIASSPNCKYAFNITMLATGVIKSIINHRVVIY